MTCRSAINGHVLDLLRRAEAARQIGTETSMTSSDYGNSAVLHMPTDVVREARTILARSKLVYLAAVRLARKEP